MRFLTVLVIPFFFFGCTSFNQAKPYESLSAEPTLATETNTESVLKALPRAKNVVTVSVYDFKDNTGQNKPADTPQYSRAVTQGGLDLLKKALLDAANQGWFRVLERGGLEHLLQERKIIRSIRSEYLTPSGQKLPNLGPLLYSGLLLEGGIVSYESNVLTGGVGARYLGIGASTQYRRDIVTVALHAVSVTSGEVLVSVTTSKTIFSTSVTGGFFKYVSFDKLVESEAGFTVNEPPQLAVRQAIEMAVYALIMEGYSRKLWKFDDPDAGLQAYSDYLVRSKGEKPKKKAAVRKPEPKKHEAPKLSAKPQPYRSDRPLVAGGSTFTAKKYVQKAAVPAKADKRAKLKNPQAAARPATAKASKASSGMSSVAKENVPRGWYIQVAAVQEDEGEGRKIISELNEAGFPVRVQKTTFESIQYMRILVGPFPTQDSAARRTDEVRHLSRLYGKAIYGKPFLKRVY